MSPVGFCAPSPYYITQYMPVYISCISLQLLCLLFLQLPPSQMLMGGGETVEDTMLSLYLEEISVSSKRLKCTYVCMHRGDPPRGCAIFAKLLGTLCHIQICTVQAFATDTQFPSRYCS